MFTDEATEVLISLLVIGATILYHLQGSLFS